jgi:hypothetical protein
MAAARSVTWDGWPSLPAGACRAAGPGRRQHPVLGDQRRGQRVDRDPGCGEPGGQEVGQSVQPGLGRRIMRADDAAGERGDPGDERDAAGPPSRMEPAAHWASRFTASISSNWAAVLSSSGWRLLSPALLTSTAHPPGPALRPGLMPHQQSGTRAAADSYKRHCAAPGFTHSGQRRFSTHFSTQRGSAAEPGSSFSWSQ